MRGGGIKGKARFPEWAWDVWGHSRRGHSGGGREHGQDEKEELCGIPGQRPLGRMDPGRESAQLPFVRPGPLTDSRVLGGSFSLALARWGPWVCKIETRKPG